MPTERYFHPEPLEEEIKISLNHQESHHLINVMRGRIGDDIEIVNGNGQLAKGIIASLEKKQAVILIKSVETQKPFPQNIILAQAIPKQNRLEFIIEKGTELGMTEIWLFPAARSEKHEFSTNQLERLHTLTVAAMKQCGRFFLPKIVIMPPLKKWNNLDVTSIFFGDVDPNATPFFAAWKTADQKNPIIFCIGPESGFSDDEVQFLKTHHARGVKLHPNILRTDTASIAALTLLTHFHLYSQ